MNPLVILTAVFAAACAAPAHEALLGAHPLGYNAALPVAPYAAHPPAINVPAPYSTAAQGPPATSIHQAPPVVTKQIHLGQTTYVAGHKTEIIKPPTPHLPIAVPTALKGSVAYNAPIVHQRTETHVVNEPYGVPRHVEVPYDVPVLREVIKEVPVAVPVSRPYAVPHPVPVAGEPIVNVHRNAPVVQRTHSNVVAPAVAHHVGYAGHAFAPAAAGYAHAGFPAAAGYAHAGYAHAGIPAAVAAAPAIVA